MAITDISYDRQQYTFNEKFDLPPRLVANANRFKYLKSLENPTKDEVAELASLTSVLEQYTMSAVEWNNLFRCMGNLQDFCVTDVKNWLNNNKTDMSDAVDSAIEKADDKIEEVNTWWAQIRSSIATQKGFNFDDITSLSGNFDKKGTITTSSGTTTIQETVTVSGLLLATRTTTIISNGTTTEHIIVYDGAGATAKIYDKTSTTTINGTVINTNVVDNLI